MGADDEILCERRGAAGVITLNRPAALNALTLGMVRVMRRSLDAWATDPAVTRVLVRAAGERAFCAGGDIRWLYELGQAGREAEALAFWREEYALNAVIKRYPKPYLALIDGIVMGGGVGISLHGSHRVAGERYLFAMPEVGIGFFPDVGATYALPRLPGAMGAYLALTGARIGPADALALGLATHTVASAVLPAIADALAAGDPIESCLAAHARPPGPAPLTAERKLIDRCFSGASVPTVLACLDAAAGSGSAFAGRTAATLRAHSPTSLAIALEQMRRGASLSFEEAMRTEFRIVARLIAGHDFYEGVRATLIDRDGRPQWRPSGLDSVSADAVARHFADLGPLEWEAV
jgi:enoyl-CoA hydratase